MGTHSPLSLLVEQNIGFYEPRGLQLSGESLDEKKSRKRCSLVLTQKNTRSLK